MLSGFYEHLHEREFLYDYLVFELADGAGGIEILGADQLAVENRVTSEDPELRRHHSQTFVGGAVPGIVDESQRL